MKSNQSAEPDRASRPHPGDSHESFDKLLLTLSPDPQEARRQYGLIRTKLVKHLEWQGAVFPEDLADETIARVARRLAEGVEIRPDKTYAFFAKTAFYVAKEVLRRRTREARALEQAPPRPVAVEAADPEPDRRLTCLRACLRSLRPEQRELILEYYGGETSHISRRQELAQRLEIPLNALRIRVHRLRAKLEASVRVCLEKHGVK